jgi:uncharacterized membrane protein YtjA (UPF0391 family)
MVDAECHNAARDLRRIHTRLNGLSHKYAFHHCFSDWHALRSSDVCARHNGAPSSEKIDMLHWTVVLLVIALIAAFLGFGGIAASAAGIAKILFFVFLILAVLSFVFGRRLPT